MKGICIDAGESLILKESQEYFLFEHGQHNYYVSKYDNVKAHCGSHHRKLFKIVEDEPFEHPNIEPVQANTKRYIARVVMPRNGYRIGDKYIISQANDKKYFSVWLLDRPNGGPVGSYINNFFEVIEQYKEQPQKAQGITCIASMSTLGINTLTKHETEHSGAKTTEKRVIEQMDIFDFI